MKKRYFLPLFVFLAFSIGSATFNIPREFFMVLQFSTFLFFFSMTYYFGIKETIKNRDPVLRVGDRMPYIMPLLLFAVPTFFSTVLFIPRDRELIVGFSFVFLLCLITYALGIFMLIRDLRKAFRKQKQSRKQQVHPEARDTKTLLLINPVNQKRRGLSMNQSSIFPPLGLGTVAALTTEDFTIKLIDENIESFRFEKADLVGITAFTSAAARAYEIAALYREKKIPVVMGGIHASLQTEEALHYVDSVVVGEAESVWREVLDDFLQGNLQTTYYGKHLELKNAPIPRRELFSDKYLFATIQTSRGCPMDCHFCSVSAFNGKRYRQRPVEEVLNELEDIPNQYIFFIDDNILGYGERAEQRAMKLFQGMIDRKLDKKWFSQASINLGMNEKVLHLAAKSGCKMIFIGLESVDPEELKAMNKQLNLRVSYERAFKNIHKYGIAVLGAFIYGSDHETHQSMMRKTEYVLNSPIDVMDMTTLTPLPGTRLFRELDNQQRLIYTDFPQDWARYDMTELTFSTKNFTPKEYERLLSKSVRKLYSHTTLYNKFLMTLIRTKSMEAALWALNSNRNFRNVSIG